MKLTNFEISDWDYTGLNISATYLDIPVTGKVESSRVAYGGEVKHTVVLDKPIQLPWRTELTERVIVYMKHITKVSSSL